MERGVTITPHSPRPTAAPQELTQHVSSMSSVQQIVPVSRPAIVVAALSISMALSACGSMRASSVGAGSAAYDEALSESVEPVLREEVARWSGTPHVLGGASANGMDCSAFVQRVFADAFDVDLPRTTEEQVVAGRRVNLSELRAGDLVFFQPPSKFNHVGIYLSEGEFAHVSSSAGVTVSELELPYWRTSYWTSRRVLSGVAVAAAREEVSPPDIEPAATVEEGSTRRVGW